MEKIVIIGLGNPILSDDSVGIQIARNLLAKNLPGNVDVKESGVSGVYLLDLLTGYDKAIIIDSIKTNNGKIGSFYRLSLDDLFSKPSYTTIHKIDLNTALELGREIGLKVPDEIVIFAIEIGDNTTFSEKCSPEVIRAIPEVEKSVLCLLKEENLN
ncbi:hypothetical protein AMJ80_08680 [bacterium SM23_31]|nr:MAG: hypothetical protein AMJ80_08680 [bacterium SM23_31]